MLEVTDSTLVQCYVCDVLTVSRSSGAGHEGYSSLHPAKAHSTSKYYSFVLQYNIACISISLYCTVATCGCAAPLTGILCARSKAIAALVVLLTNTATDSRVLFQIQA